MSGSMQDDAKKSDGSFDFSKMVSGVSSDEI